MEAKKQKQKQKKGVSLNLKCAKKSTEYLLEIKPFVWNASTLFPANRDKTD